MQILLNVPLGEQPSSLSWIFDPEGLLAPIICSFKIDLKDLTILKLDWDDEIPDII